MSGLDMEVLRRAVEIARQPDPPECFFTGPWDDPCEDCGEPYKAPCHKWPHDRLFHEKVSEAYIRLVTTEPAA